ncbi:hypothetical protein JYU04_00065 [Dehalococcoides mccartyi]|nr:hypothetical protein [Dehalococcoides mccartyi]
MTQSPVIVSTRGGKGLYKLAPNGLRKPGTKSKPKKLHEYLEPDEVGALMEFAPTVLTTNGPEVASPRTLQAPNCEFGESVHNFSH